MLRVLLSICFSFFVAVQAALSQTLDTDIAWVQVEAQPSLTIATQRAQLYAQDLQDVNGFDLGSGWYAIALGPYRRVDAEEVLNVYRNEGLIPRDAFVAQTSAFRRQFWPVGANVLGTTETATPQDTASASVVPAPEPEIKQVDETPRQARASEAALTKAERKELQSWLKWAGYYTSAIDGAFGRGTRASMSRWQADNGWDATGVMTTLQREELRDQYFAVLKGMDLRTVINADAGIEMQIPMGVVRETATEFPFVRFEASGDNPAKVLMISQGGDQSTLFGLYDIMQTLEIVPLEGERTRKKDSFVLTGRNAKIISHTEVSLKNGEIKGFTLVWPTGDEERRTRILGEMQATFSRVDGVLDPAAGSNDAQSIDLLAGLNLRKPKMSRSGFFVDNNGVVVTTAQAVQSCTKVTLDNDYEATVVGIDDRLGVAVLRPVDGLSPMAVATLRDGDARLQSDVAVSGYSYEGILGAPTLTFGTLADVKGLAGDTAFKRLALTALPGDVGGPVFDSEGTVLGLLLPKTQANGQQLPSDVSFAVGADTLRTLLDQSGVSATSGTGNGTLAAENITRLAADMTVLVSCWN